MQKAITSHVSITGLFIVLVLILTIPLVVVTLQTPQDLRQRAATLEPSPIPLQTTDDDGYISGYIYLDQNENGEREYAELGAPNVKLKITTNNTDPNQTPVTSIDLITDQNGYFKYPFSNSGQSTFLVELTLPEGFKTINTNPKNLVNTQNNAKEIIEFGIFPIKTLPPQVQAITAAPTLPPGLSL